MIKAVARSFKFLSALLLIALGSHNVYAALDTSTLEARKLVAKMSLSEKIGQKLMLDFRYWCSRPTQTCRQDFVMINPDIKRILRQNHIGGVILFANNLKNVPQIVRLTDALQKTMQTAFNLPLLIGTDQEGGIVTRLPQDQSVSFPGNMALAAAYLGHPSEQYTAIVGQTLGINLKAVGINLNFAPDVDVTVNPQNPVINVRAFSDDSKLVAKLGMQMNAAMQAVGVASTLKHFPGHGDTSVDSHIGLPLVQHTKEQAWQIDLYPFKKIIEQQGPDLIMTAHIQFPALDNQQIYANKVHKTITVPATLSRKIQYDLLRKQLHFHGVTITDALDMGAIADNFDPMNATIKAFEAGDDIALMPVELLQARDHSKLTDLITGIEAAVKNGKISQEELDQSVLRIVLLKIKLGLLQPDHRSLSEKIKEAQKILTQHRQRVLERKITNAAITLVQNNTQVLPIKSLANTYIYALMPSAEQATGIATEITRLQKTRQLSEKLHLQTDKITGNNFATVKRAIDQADIFMVGSSTTKSSPANTESFSNVTMNQAQFIYKTLRYAHTQGKKTIFLSLSAPYDLANYKDVSDVLLAGYNPYGYYVKEDGNGYYRGPSLPALVRALFGIDDITAKLPVNISDPYQPNKIIFSRGYGLSLSKK